MKSSIFIFSEIFVGLLLSSLLFYFLINHSSYLGDSYGSAIVIGYTLLCLSFILPVLSIGYFHFKFLEKASLYGRSVRNLFVGLTMTSIFYILTSHFAEYDLGIGWLYVLIIPFSVVISFNFILIRGSQD